MYRLLPHQILVASPCHSTHSLVEVLTLFTRLVMQDGLGISKKVANLGSTNAISRNLDCVKGITQAEPSPRFWPQRRKLNGFIQF